MTDTDGQYVIDKRGFFPIDELKVVCLPADPELEADSTVVNLKYNTDNAHDWYVGDAKETVNFKLKPKEAQEE